VDRPSAAGTVAALIADLSSERPVVRETALARLTVIGARAVVHLTTLAEDADAPVASRIAALRALEAIGDARAIDGIASAIDAQDAEVAAAAAAAARTFLRGPRGAVLVDRLTAAAIGAHRDERVRVAAVRTLRELERSTVAPLLETLARDASAAVRAVTVEATSVDPADVVMAAAEQGLPDDPADVWSAVSLAGASVALPVLLQLIERLRAREGSEAAAGRAQWMRVRGHVHLALAARGSRIALYDLRESLEGADAPLPVEFLAALSTAGDASCAEAVAAAYSRALAPRARADRQGPAAVDDDLLWWRDRLADAFRAIVAREHLTSRHAVMKKIRKRWPEILALQ
jgi:hypothetical protein